MRLFLRELVLLIRNRGHRGGENQIAVLIPDDADPELKRMVRESHKRRG
jgi:hypothetical protein